jgi:hypothetical protein
VFEVRTFVAERPADLEDLLHPTDDQSLEVQLGRDPQVQIEVVGVDVGLERARSRRRGPVAGSVRPLCLSGGGRSDLLVKINDVAETDSSPFLVVITSPVTLT